MKKVLIIFSVFLLVIMLSVVGAESATLVDFDSIPATAADEVPRSGGGWTYNVVNGMGGWESSAGYVNPNEKIKNYFRNFSPSYNTAHMGFENYGYLEISKEKAISGNSLKYVVTGGKNSFTCPNGNGPTCLGSGLPLNHKETYLNYLKSGNTPVLGDLAIGNPYLYFGNNSSSSIPTPFEEAKGMNRLSFYVWLPPELGNGAGGYLVPPSRTISVGPYSNVPTKDVFPLDVSDSRIGGHWYHDFSINGGGWVHLMIDGHPQHNNGFSNASLYPYPSKSIRDISKSYFENLYRFYFTTGKYDGFSVPKYNIFVDNLEFLNDIEPQNNETINGLAISFKPGNRSFEISFNDKYKDNQYSYSTYEVRYSFQPITNTNWAESRPVQVLPHTGFTIDASSNGRFDKNTPYYQLVWAPFKLDNIGESLLENGKTIYFAVKDVSQMEGDGLDPIARTGGRDYRKYPNTFDYDGDKLALKLIKRTNFYIMGLPPANVKNLIIKESIN